METKHTKGEWEASGNGVFKKGQSDNIAVVTKCGNRFETEANAKLIAAAPELLEALVYAKKRILFLEQYTEGKCDKSDVIKINNAIKKATE